jgi:hypothetical protein
MHWKFYSSDLGVISHEYGWDRIRAVALKFIAIDNLTKKGWNGFG